MNDVMDDILLKSWPLHHMIQKLLQNRWPVNTVNQKIVKLIPYSFQLSWRLLLEDHVGNLLDFLLVGSNQSLGIVLDILCSLKLNYGQSQVAVTVFHHWLNHLLVEVKSQVVWFFWSDYAACIMDFLFRRGWNSDVDASRPNGRNQFMDFWTNQNHPAILHVHLHCSSQSSLSLFRQLFGLMDDKNFKCFGIFWNFHTLGWSDLLNDALNDVRVMMLVIRRSDFDVIVALIDCKFNANTCMLWFENSIFAFELVDMFAEYFLQKTVGTSFLSSTFGSVEYHMLIVINNLQENRSFKPIGTEL